MGRYRPGGQNRVRRRYRNRNTTRSLNNHPAYKNSVHGGKISLKAYQKMVCDQVFPGGWDVYQWTVTECIQDGLTIDECMESIIAEL